jgi:hypothetical protein
MFHEGASMLHHERMQRSHKPFVVGVLVLLIMVGGALPRTAQGRLPTSGGVVGGFVRDHLTGAGMAATVRVGDQVLHTSADGTIPTTTIPFHTSTRTVDVLVEASGYPTWRYDDVELAQAHPVELHVKLGAPVVPSTPAKSTAGMHNATRLATVSAASLDQPPDFITIGRTFNTTCVYPPTNVQRVDRVPFMVYVRNVLPFEWIHTWPAASLDAGAVAASQFAWSTALLERKWTKRGYPFDVLDSTCDQVYADRTATQNFSSTDAAVARMWGTVLLRDNKLITTYFRNTDERCELVGGSDCMGQYGSRDRANEGMNGLEILQHYYDPITPTVRLPSDRAVVWERSPYVHVSPGTTPTLSLRLLNVGASTWGRDTTELRVVNPANPDSEHQSLFRHSSWVDATHPAQLSVGQVVRGQDHTFRFTINVPSVMPYGTYQFALRWQHADGTPIGTDTPLVWTINVGAPLEPQVWLPLIR